MKRGWRLFVLLWPLVLCAQGAGNPLRLPIALAYDAAGNLYLADAGRHQVLEATLAGTLVVIAGTGAQGSGGDGGAATAAQLNAPQGIALGADGTVYIADTGNARVRAVNMAGTIFAVAGTGVPGDAGDGASALAARFRRPTALAVDSTGALLVCDTGSHRVRRVAGSLGTTGALIATVAGTGVQGFSGDGGPASAAQLDSPSGVAVASDERVFIADSHNQRVRVLDSGGNLVTLAGSGERGMGGDGGAAAAALLAEPRQLALTTAGDLLVADPGNQRVRSVAASGAITTLAGSGMEGNSPAGVAAGAALLRSPRGVAWSPFGFAALADTLNGTVRLVGQGTLLYPAGLGGGLTTTLAVGGAATQAYGQARIVATSSSDQGAPAGQVVVSEGGIPEASAGVTGGAALLDLSILDAGTHQLAVSYGGDGLHLPANATATLHIVPLELSAVAADVSLPYGSPLPVIPGTLGGVLDRDAGKVTATFGITATDPAPTGTYPIGASLSGAKALDYTLASSNAGGVLRVVPASSTTTMAGPGPSYAGLQARLTASVAPASRGVPTGNVQFLSGSRVVATATLVNGSASTMVTAPDAGDWLLTASYGGDGNFLSSNSPVQVARVVALPDFTVAGTGSGTATVSAAGVATYTINVSGQAGAFTGAVTLSASGLPAKATATFAPPTVIPGSGSAAVVLTVQIPASSAKARTPAAPRRAVVLATVGFGALLLAGGFRRRARHLGLAAAVLLLGGCGARTVSEGSAESAAKVYALQVTGTATNLAGQVVAHSTSLSLSVP